MFPLVEISNQSKYSDTYHLSLRVVSLTRVRSCCPQSDRDTECSRQSPSPSVLIAHNRAIALRTSLRFSRDPARTGARHAKDIAGTSTEVYHTAVLLQQISIVGVVRLHACKRICIHSVLLSKHYARTPRKFVQRETPKVKTPKVSEQRNAMVVVVVVVVLCSRSSTAVGVSSS